VDLVDTMDGVDLVEQAHIPAFEMQGSWDDDPNDVL
jgi:hypothetical protein